jgi:hypothetical protein
MSEASSSAHPANHLEQAASSYLRSARHQPVQWHAWGEAAFARAQAENKPVLLDIGAVWCHWCHVMDRESYEDAEIAAVINQHYIAVKVDRDERPDVDARYQAAVSAISGQGGWPLTAFLTPDGRPFFGGTYFPRDDRYGRPGFGRILSAMATVWRERREEALETASSVMAAIEHNESFSGRAADMSHALSPALAEKMAASILKQFDPRNGGFGAQPKFPHPAALDLLLEEAVNRGNAEARTAFTVTLEKMARGGVYDHLAGGFHRYSVDERWVVPHFEKMLYDNTELLRNYVHGYQSFVREDFLVIAREIVAWLDGTMTDRERGGFYASQDADVGLDDDGDYFTWTVDEARAVLDKDELELVREYYDLGDLGDMHHNPAKNVLHVNQPLRELVLKSARPVESRQSLLESARSKLLAARALRTTPFIDRTLYTGWNAMAVTAYCETARVLRMQEARAFALKTLDRILAEAWDGESELRHVIAYPDGLAASEMAPGTLEDYAFTIHACIDAWLAGGEMRHYGAAVKLADAMIARFHDATGGGFFDAAAPAPDALPLGALSARRKPLQDAPTPAGNPTAAAALLRLEALSAREQYGAIAEETLACFAGIVEHFGLYAGSYGLALERLLSDPVQVVAVGRGEDADRLEAAAVAGYAVNKVVIRMAPENLVAANLPAVLEETLLAAPRPGGANAWAYVCKGRACLPPVSGEEALREAMAMRV